MKCQKHDREKIISFDSSVLFTISFKKSKYAVLKNIDAYECVCLTWNIWNGFRYSDKDVADEIIRICNRIIELSEMHPEKYKLEGEHYSIFSVGQGQEKRLRIDKIYKTLFSGIKQSGPPLIRFAFSILISLFLCNLFIDEIVSWVPYVIPASAISYTALKVLVYTVEVVCTCVLFLTFDERQSPIALYLNAAISIGLVILLGVMKKWFVIALVVPFAAFILYKCIGQLCCAFDLKEEKICERKWKLLMLRSTFIVLVACTILFTGVLKLTPYNAYTGNAGSDQSSLATEIPEELQAKYRQACWNLYEPTFTEKTWQENLDILQVICDYECLVNSGCVSAQVCAGSTKDDKTLGYYNNATRTITINIDHLCNSNTEDVLDTLLHEVRHHIQHRLVDMYCSLEPHLQDEYRNMSPFKEAASFLDNLNDYHESTEDYDLYYNQTIEKDSRQWATTRLRWYDSFIDGSR